METPVEEAAGPGSRMSETEHTIADLWREVLPASEITDPSDNFFALGGTSIDMVMALFRIGEEFRLKLPDNAIFDAPSLRELSALVDSLLPNRSIAAD